MSKTYYFSDFDGQDNVSRLTAALDCVKADEGATLIIEPGEYVLTDELSKSNLENVMSGEWGKNPQRIMATSRYEYSTGLDLDGHVGTKIIADRVKFIIDGFMAPISVKNSENVTIEGLEIDHLRKPFSIGKVKNCATAIDGSVYADVELYDGFTVLENTPHSMRWLVLDRDTGRLVNRSFKGVVGLTVDEKNVRFSGPRFTGDIEGLDVYIWHTLNSRPAVLLEYSKNVTLKNMTVRSQPGMGLVAYHAETVTLDGFKCVPDGDIALSVNTDAAHFFTCSGEITVKNSEFSGFGGFGVKVYGHYHSVLIAEGSSCIVRNEAPDGTPLKVFDYPSVGSTLEAVDMNELKSYGTFTVLDMKKREDGPLCELVLSGELPRNAFDLGLMLYEVKNDPIVNIADSRFVGGLNKPLSVSASKVKIENNEFINASCTAITVAPNIEKREGCVPKQVSVYGNSVSSSAEFPGIEVLCAGEDVTVENNDVSCPFHTPVIISSKNK